MQIIGNGFDRYLLEATVTIGCEMLEMNLKCEMFEHLSDSDRLHL